MGDEQLHRGRFDHVGDCKLNSVGVFVRLAYTGELLRDNISILCVMNIVLCY